MGYFPSSDFLSPHSLLYHKRSSQVCKPLEMLLPPPCEVSRGGEFASSTDPVAAGELNKFRIETRLSFGGVGWGGGWGKFSYWGYFHLL